MRQGADLSFFDELKQRNVIRVAGLYVVGSWLIAQVATTILPYFKPLAWLVPIVLTVLAIGFVPALLFAWAFEITPQGLKREHQVRREESIAHLTGKQLDRIIIVVLSLALGYFAFDKFVLSPAREQALARTAREEGRAEAIVGSFGDKSIAVLPFTDMSAEKDQGYFSDGIAEELLSLLAKVPELRVISRSSAFSFKGQDLPMSEIAKRLNVAHVLEGSVRKTGQRVRVTAQLIEAKSDRHLWSATYDRTLDDIFAVQDEISAAVVGELKATLLGEKHRATRIDAAAFDLFLRGREFARLHTAEGYEQAIELLNRALDIDSSYAPAWTVLAYCYRRQANNGMRPIADGYRLAGDALRRALAIDAEYAQAYAELGRVALDYENDVAAAAAQLERALALDPSNAGVLGYSALVAVDIGRFDLASALNQRALELDPLNPTLHNSVGFTFRFSGRLDEAIAEYRKVLELSPHIIATRYRIGETLLLKREPAAALAEIQTEPSEAWRLSGLALAHHSLGHAKEAGAALADLIAKHRDARLYQIATIMAWRGDADAAFQYLELAHQESSPDLTDAASDQFFAGIHQDPRWLPLMRKLGMAPEQLHKIRFEVH